MGSQAGNQSGPSPGPEAFTLHQVTLRTREGTSQARLSCHPDLQRPEVRKPCSSPANPLAQDRASDKVRRNQESCPAASGEDSLAQDAVVISSSQSHREKTEWWPAGAWGGGVRKSPLHGAELPSGRSEVLQVCRTMT